MEEKNLMSWLKKTNGWERLWLVGNSLFALLLFSWVLTREAPNSFGTIIVTIVVIAVIFVGSYALGLIVKKIIITTLKFKYYVLFLAILAYFYNPFGLDLVDMTHDHSGRTGLDLVEMTNEHFDYDYDIRTDSFAFTNGQDECYEYSYLNRKDIKNLTGYDIEIFSNPHEKPLASGCFDCEDIRRYFTPKEHLVESCASLPRSDWSHYSYSEELIFFNKNIISVNRARGEYNAGAGRGSYASSNLLLDFKKKNKVIWSDLFGWDSEEFEELIFEWVFENHADKNFVGDDIDSVYIFKRNFTVHPCGLKLHIPSFFIGTMAQGELSFLVPWILLKKYISTEKYDYYFSNPVNSGAVSFSCK